MADKDKLVYQAKLAEQAERYDEMVTFMTQVAELGNELQVEERNLLSVAFKNAVGARRASWRVMSSIEGKEQEKSSDKVGTVKEYKGRVETELKGMCESVLSVLKKHLIPSSSTDEAKIFFYKMEGDYCRYLAETSTGDDKKSSSEQAMEAYKKATEIAVNTLPPTHPIRLGLALNFSVFYYEIDDDRDKAIGVAKNAFDDAIADLDSVGEESYKDSTLIMQLLRDNLTLWTSEYQAAEDGGED